MAEFPALPLWTDAYLADTRHLTTEEHGAYLLLMMEAWRRPECNLPDDDRVLCRLTGLPADRWTAIKPVVMAFWKRDGRRKTWTQKRLSSERHYVAQKSQSQRDKAAKRWKNTENLDATAMPDGCPDDAPTPTPTPTYSVGTDVPTAAGAAKDPERVMFDAGRALLGQAGIGAERAGEMLGRWKKSHGAAVVIDAIARCQREGSPDPVSFIEGVFRWRARPSKALPQVGEQRTDNEGRTWEYSGAVDGWMEVRG